MQSFRRRALGVVWPLALFVALTIFLTYPFALHLTDHLRDNGDSYEYAWDIGFGAYQLTHDPLHLYSGNIFYPFPLSLAYSDSTVPSIVLGTPIVLLTNNPVLALNILIMLTFVLGGYGMYLFVSERTGSRMAGVVAGIIYGFSPYRFDHLAQLPNVSMEWAPFALWSFERYLANGRYRWAASFTLFCVLQVLVSFYYAFILGIGIAVYVVGRLVQNRWKWTHPRWLLPFLGFGLLGALIAAPLIVPYFIVEHAFGLKRTLSEATLYSAWPANFIAPTPSMKIALIDPLIQLVYHKPWQHAPIGASERHLYPGLVVVLLAAVGVASRRIGRSTLPILMVILSVLLAFGPVLHLHQHVERPLPFPMPYTILFHYLPGFAALRVPSRFAALTIQGLAILAGDGLCTIQHWLARWKPPVRTFIRPSLAVSLLCAGIAIAESLNTFPTTAVHTGAAVPPVYRWLANDPTPGPIVELPIDGNAFHESPRSYYSTYYHRLLINGFRSFLPPAYLPLAATIQTFPSLNAVNTLDRMNVRYVVVHESQYPASQQIMIRQIGQRPGIQVAARFGSDVVYRLTGMPGPENVQLTNSPSCLSQVGSIEHLQVALRSRNSLPILVLTPNSHDIAFNLGWQGRSGETYHEIVREPVPAWVIQLPTSFDIPYHVPAKAGTYRLTITFANQPDLRAPDAENTWFTVGAVSQMQTAGPPSLASASLESPRAIPNTGVGYQLTWQVTKPPHPLQVFVNVYDKQNVYWSYPSGTETRFPISSVCPGGLTLESDTLPLRPGAPPGQYWVEAGLIDTTTNKRTSFVSPSGEKVTRVVIGSFWIPPANVYSPGTLPSPAGQAFDFADQVSLDTWQLDGKVSPGTTLRLTLNWRAEHRMVLAYTAFVHVVDSAGRIVAQNDGQPAGNKFPTSAWLPGEMVNDQVAVTLPKTLPPGPYHIQVGLYDLKTGQRLLVVGANGTERQDHVDLATLNH